MVSAEPLLGQGGSAGQGPGSAGRSVLLLTLRPGLWPLAPGLALDRTPVLSFLTLSSSLSPSHIRDPSPGQAPCLRSSRGRPHSDRGHHAQGTSASAAMGEEQAEGKTGETPILRKPGQQSGTWVQVPRRPDSRFTFATHFPPSGPQVPHLEAGGWASLPQGHRGQGCPPRPPNKPGGDTATPQRTVPVGVEH